jgi:hypothetical protein
VQKPDPGNNLSKDPAIQLFTLSGSAYKPTILLPIGIGTKASLVIKPEVTNIQDLPLLVVLDWYIRLMMVAIAGTVMA